MEKTIITFVLIAFLGFIVAVEFDRPCRFAEMSPRVKRDFNVRAYTGLWYEIKRYEEINQFDMDCVQARYTEFGGLGVNATNSGHLQNGTRFELSGFASPSEEGVRTGAGFLQVQFFPQRKIEKFR